MQGRGTVSGRLLSYGGVLVVVVVLVVAMVGLLVRGDGDAPTGTTSALTLPGEGESPPPPDQRPKVEVLNGCGVSGIAASAEEYLRGRGFDVVNVENASGFDYAESLVIDRGGDLRIAQQVARALGTEDVIRQVRSDLLLDVTVILGKGYKSLKPYKDIEP